MTDGRRRGKGRRVKLCSMDTSTDRAKAKGPPEMVIRRVRPADQPALRGFYAALAPETRRARFLGYVAGVSDDASRSFCTPDHMHAEGFLCLLPTPGGDAGVVGHLCLEPAGPGRLELAVAVADAYQGRGIGRRLMEAALGWAAEHGTSEIVASAFADNSRVLRLLSSAPHGAHILPADGGLVDVVIPLAAPVPTDLAVPAPAELRMHRRSATPGSVRPRCHVVWRRRPPPVPAAED